MQAGEFNRVSDPEFGTEFAVEVVKAVVLRVWALGLALYDASHEVRVLSRSLPERIQRHQILW